MKAGLSTIVLLKCALGLLVGAEPVGATIQESTSPGSAVRDPGSLGSTQSAQELIQSKWTEILGVLREPDAGSAVKKAEIERIAGPIIDFALMGKLALGRAHWGRLTATQRETYLQRFEERVKKSYREKIVLYEDKEIRIDFAPDDLAEKSDANTPGKAGDKKSRTAVIMIALLTGGNRATVLHKLRWFDSQWRVYDVEIDGVSILRTYRSQFHDILRTGSVEELLSRMQGPLPDQPSNPDTAP
ncbi:MAG: MlaC/ttg2D family ABC transporter substrate-binding protein [Planctomycetota bacterium]|jgi:phospholipid transport system substrate-binding protein